MNPAGTEVVISKTLPAGNFIITSVVDVYTPSIDPDHVATGTHAHPGISLTLARRILL